ncbi:TRAP transporter permease, partial [Chloroflexota bacterium]
MLIFQLITIRFAFINSIELQTVHLAFALTLVFLTSLESSKQKKLWPLFLIMILAGLLAAGYVITRFEHLEIAVGLPDTIDVIIGIILMIVVLEATRQSWGVVFFSIIIVFILYFFIGQYAPFGLKHPGFAFDYVVSKLGIGFSGIYSEFLNASVQYVFLFMVLGGLLKATGTVELILDLGKVIGKFTAGGRAQTAVVGSGLVGTITGAAVTNVILTGSFTIPAMKKMGYPPDIAGAIESTASTGGQLMPPVMGASAFIMATILGIPYRDIMLAAIIPAFLYYFQVFASVEVIARQKDLRMPPEPMNLKPVLRRAPPFVIAVGILFVLLLRGVSPSFAATYSLVAALGVAFLLKETRPSWSNLAENITDGVMVGARLAVILASVGMIAQTLYSTGLGIKLTGLAEVIASGQIIIFILLTMIISLILGCGVPTIGAYTLVALIVAPALVRAGFPILQVHFFAFYFAIISAITPPVALAAVA